MRPGSAPAPRRSSGNEVTSMADPVTVAIASAVAGKAAESLSEQGKQVVSAITRRIREKFRGHPAELATLDAVSDDEARVGELAELLGNASAADAEFGQQIRALWAQVTLTVAGEGVINVFHGKADKVIQLRDMHTDL